MGRRTIDYFLDERMLSSIPVVSELITIEFRCGYGPALGRADSYPDTAACTGWFSCRDGVMALLKLTS